MPNLLLVLDIGNTNVKFGLFDGEELTASWQMATDVHRMPDEYGITMLHLMRHKGIDVTQIKEAALSCVVAPLLGPFNDVCQKYFNVVPLVVGPGVKTGIRIRMDNPREVGTDRIANAAGAHSLYTGPVIIVALGTATAFDTVSKEGEYLGGAIAPGIGIAAEALFTRTAALPRVELVRPKHAIGTNTVSAMQSGIVFGYAGLIDNVVTKIQEELGEKATVVATGGLSSIIAKETKVIEKVNPNLTLIGIRIIHSLNKS